MPSDLQNFELGLVTRSLQEEALSEMKVQVPVDTAGTFPGWVVIDLLSLGNLGLITPHTGLKCQGSASPHHAT